MMHDLLLAIWANILPILIGAACSAVPVIFATLKATTWWPKLGPVGRLIETAVNAEAERVKAETAVKVAATTAVAAQNRERVNAVRATDLIGYPPGKVPPTTAREAKGAALADAITAVVTTLNPTAGELAGPLIAQIDVAIENAVQDAKNPDLPVASANALPDVTS